MAAPRLPCVLLTGFEPFAGDALNPSQEVVRALNGRRVRGHRIHGACLPTEFGRSLEVLLPLVRELRPVLVLSTGLAGGRSGLSLERVAINLVDARIPDNAGAQPVDTPVLPGAPAACFSTLPIKAMLEALQGAGVPAEASLTAGTFVCNHLFYGLMHALATEAGLRGTRGGFIHLPWLPGQGEPCLPLAQMVTGLRTAIACALSRA